MFESLLVPVVHDLDRRTDGLDVLALQGCEQLVESARDERSSHRRRTFDGSSRDSHGRKFDLGDISHRVLLCDELLDQDQATLGIDELASESLTLTVEHIVD